MVLASSCHGNLGQGGRNAGSRRAAVDFELALIKSPTRPSCVATTSIYLSKYGRARSARVSRERRLIGSVFCPRSGGKLADRVSLLMWWAGGVEGGGVTGSYRRISCSLKSYRKVIYKVRLKSTQAAAHNARAGAHFRRRRVNAPPWNRSGSSSAVGAGWTDVCRRWHIFAGVNARLGCVEPPSSRRTAAAVAAEACRLIQKSQQQNMLADYADSAPPALVLGNTADRSRSDGCKRPKLLISANHFQSAERPHSSSFSGLGSGVLEMETPKCGGRK